MNYSPKWRKQRLHNSLQWSNVSWIHGWPSRRLVAHESRSVAESGDGGFKGLEKRELADEG